MSVTLGVTVEARRLEEVPADVLVAPFFETDRPLRGPAARIDWRLCGLLSERLREDRIAGALGEAVLLLSGGRLRAERLLALGLGPREGFGIARMRAAGAESVRRLVALRTGIGAVALPSPATAQGLGAGAAAGALLEGAAEALFETPAPLALRIVVEPGDLQDARRGVSEAASRAAVAVRLLRPEAPADDARPAGARSGAGKAGDPEGAVHSSPASPGPS